MLATYDLAHLGHAVGQLLKQFLVHDIAFIQLSLKALTRRPSTKTSHHRASYALIQLLIIRPKTVADAAANAPALQ